VCEDEQSLDSLSLLYIHLGFSYHYPKPILCNGPKVGDARCMTKTLMPASGPKRQNVLNTLYDTTGEGLISDRKIWTIQDQTWHRPNLARLQKRSFYDYSNDLPLPHSEDHSL